MLRIKYDYEPELLEECGFDLYSDDNYGMYLKPEVQDTLRADEVFYIELADGRIVLSCEGAAGKSLEILYKMIEKGLVENN